MWEKTTCCNMSLSSFNLEILLQWFCTGAVLYQYAGCNLQRATTLSRFPVSPGRELQPPTSFLTRTTFHKFSNWIHKHQMIIKYKRITQSTVVTRSKIIGPNPEHLMNRKIQSTDHLKTGTQFSFLWPTTGRSLPSAALRADALFL